MALGTELDTAELDTQSPVAQMMNVETVAEEAKHSDVDLRYIIRRKIEDRLDRKRLIEEFGQVDDLDF